MHDDVQRRVALDILSVPPLVFRMVRRRLISMTLADTNLDIKLLHFEIMRVLKDEGTLHPAKIGEKLLIAKAQMTHLIDKLVELEFVKREMCSDDRRTINITLTDKGREVLEEQDNLVINAMQENMSSLTDAELEDLSGSLRKLRDILFKLEQ
ncbi:MAG: MarR family transcriptional regulator [Dehalococcoidales bacterium]|nr:MarR family transcriptional regulator [Dehalococcoidales bacterium]